MASTTHAHLPSLAEHRRDDVGNQLPAMLAELADTWRERAS